MGVECTTYLMMGIKLPYSVMDEYKINNDDLYLPYIEGHENIKYTLIIDGMNGEYVVFGKVLATLVAYDDDFYIMNEKIAIEKDEIFDDEDYSKVLNKLFPNITLSKPKYSILMFNHLS
jgi:hypothetical protein